MPRPKRRSPARRGYGSQHVEQLRSGCDWFGDAFGGGPRAVSAMRTAWPALSEAVEAAQAARGFTWPVFGRYLCNERLGAADASAKYRTARDAALKRVHDV